MKKLLCLVMLYLPFMMRAQSNNDHKEEINNKGIQWTEGLSWEQVKEKAKSENKYIFLDCFATWCGPCKEMDKDVYPNDTVGNYFNEKFVSIKVQMDQNQKDNQQVKSWYSTADSLAKLYRILVFPTYIFLSPEGTIVYGATGYKSVSKFVAAAKVATRPGQSYDNPYAEYDSLLVDYNNGIKNYKRLPYMIKTALKIREIQTAQTLVNDYGAYLKTLKEDELYTKDNVYYFTLGISSKSRWFHLFYPDGRRIDSVMDKKGYAETIVDGVIEREEVEPFSKVNGNDGMHMQHSSTPKGLPQLKWRNLFKKIRKKYNADYARRNVWDAKVNWYCTYCMYPEYIKYFILRLKKYGVDLASGFWPNPNVRLNAVAWDVFMNITDKAQINAAIKWMQELMSMETPDYTHFDTYASLLYKANLLYKIGKKEEALIWEQKAVEEAMKWDSKAEVEYFEATLGKMKRGEPTWPVSSPEAKK